MDSELRQPRPRVSLRGRTLDGVLSVDIESNNHFAADRFRIGLVAALVQESELHLPGGQIEIEIGDGEKWVSCLTGTIDKVSFDPIAARLTIEGRDLSSTLIETQLNETFANRTASEIATLIGLRHGLLVAADPTTTPVGRYYQSEHDRTTLGQFAKTMTEWDLLAYLATNEGFDLYMIGRTLRFGFPVPTGSRSLRTSDCLSIHLHHAIALARPIDVQVRSWRSKTGDSAIGRTLTPGIGEVWQRRITRPNLTDATAQRQSVQVAADLKRHEWAASVTMPGEFGLSARSVVLLSDTQSPWDRLYRVQHISRSLDMRRGFTQTLTLQGLN